MQYRSNCKKCGECGKSARGRKWASGIYCCQEFLSRTAGETYRIRQSINCKSQNMIYLVNCKNCGMQGVGSCKTLAKQSKCLTIFQVLRGDRQDARLSNILYVKVIASVLGIVQLENPPPDPTECLREFEGYWIIKLNTLEPHGMNSINEYEQIIKKVASRQCLKIYQVPPNTISWTMRIAFQTNDHFHMGRDWRNPFLLCLILS